MFSNQMSLAGLWAKLWSVTTYIASDGGHFEYKSYLISFNDNKNGFADPQNIYFGIKIMFLSELAPRKWKDVIFSPSDGGHFEF